MSGEGYTQNKPKPHSETQNPTPKVGFCALKWLFFAPKMAHFEVFLRNFVKS